MSDKALRIFALQAENFMRLRTVSVTLDGSPVVCLVGENAQGKTSFLEAIASALGGEKLCPKVPIRHGEDHAEVTVDLGEFIVTRRWTENGSTLTVKSPEGMKYSGPQALLDRLCSKIAFDPLAFTRAKPAEQVEILRELVGLDFRIFDTQRKTLYDQRTEVNREVARLKATVDGMKIVEAPDEPVSVAELLKQQDAALVVQRRRDDLERAARSATNTKTQAEEAVTRARKALAEAEKALQSAKEQEEEAAGELALAEKPDLDTIRQGLAKAQETNDAVRQKKERAAASSKLRAKEREAADFTAKIEALDKNKGDALASAKFPVAGLSFSEEGVTLNGVPLQQASGAEGLRVSLAIGLARNPRLNLMLIRDGSLLDEKSMRLVSEMAEAAGAQVFIERVARPGETGLLIEDGAVVRPAPRLVPAEARP